MVWTVRFRCEHCNAGYSVPDSRVVQKVVRMQCLRCKGEIRIVGPRTAELKASVLPPEFEHEWYVIVDGDRQGPFLENALTSKLEAGELKRATHAWRPGMEGWLHLDAISELAPFASASHRLADALVTLDAFATEDEPRKSTVVAPPPFVPIVESRSPEDERTGMFTFQARVTQEKSAKRRPRVWLVVASVLAAAVIVVVLLVFRSRPLVPEKANAAPLPILAPPVPVLLPPATEIRVERPKPPVSSGKVLSQKPAALKVQGILLKDDPSTRPTWLTADNVKRSLALNQDSLAPCMAKDPAGTPTVKLTVGAQIDPNGRMKTLAISPSKMDGAKVGHCIREILSAMRFPRSTETRDLELSLSVGP